MSNVPMQLVQHYRIMIHASKTKLASELEDYYTIDETNATFVSNGELIQH